MAGRVLQTNCQWWRRPSSACRHLLAVKNGEKGLAATPAIPLSPFFTGVRRTGETSGSPRNG